MLALIFRGNAHWTTGWAFGRALTHLGVEHKHLDNNDIWAGKVSLLDYDTALCLDDGFALKSRVLPNMPARSAYWAVDMHNEPDAYIPYLHQFGKVYCAQYTYGVELVRNYSNAIDVEWLPLAWDSIGIPYIPYDDDEDLYYPVSFIASATTEQRAMLRDLVRYKYDGETQECFREDLGERLSGSRIGLNVIGGVGYHTAYTHIAQRPFEVMGCGALLVQQDLWNPFTNERIPDMELLGLKGVQGWFRNVRPNGEHFWDRKEPNGDEHYVYWKDYSSLTATLDYYLHPDNEQERAAIAKRGQEWVMNNHTYIHRTKTILDYLGIGYG